LEALIGRYKYQKLEPKLEPMMETTKLLEPKLEPTMETTKLLEPKLEPTMDTALKFLVE
jgi:hypothetical protein